MYLCVYNTTHQPKTQPWPDQTKALSHRGGWPFVTDVSDNLKNTTTQNSVLLFSLLLTPGNHFGHFTRHDSKIKRHNLGEIISKRTRSVSQPQTNTGTQVVISELGIYQAGAEHILCLYLPRCNGRYDNRSAWRKLKQHPPHALQLLKADRMKRWLVSLKSLKIVLSGVQVNIRLLLSILNGLVWNVATSKDRGNLHRRWICPNVTESENCDPDKSFYSF